LQSDFEADIEEFLKANFEKEEKVKRLQYFKTAI